LHVLEILFDSGDLFLAQSLDPSRVILGFRPTDDFVDIRVHVGHIAHDTGAVLVRLEAIVEYVAYGRLQGGEPREGNTPGNNQK
jgi:hypothetical protein